MSDELTLRAALEFTKGTVTKGLSINPTTFDVAGSLGIENIQSIGFATDEAVNVGDIAAGGYFMIRNLDATNFVELRPGTGLADLIQLKPGDFCIFRLATDAALWAQADTAAAKIEVVAIDL